MPTDNLPHAKSTRDPDDPENLRKLIARLGLTGLANNTKWDEFIDAMRARTDWRPCYRCKCIDGDPSDWDCKWFYHLPFPMFSVEWLDLCFLVEIQNDRLPRGVTVIDHSGWMIELLTKIGLDFRVGKSMIRIFGYGPRSDRLFDE